jgi:uncharacterized protein YaaN involved in tellurite resistance
MTKAQVVAATAPSFDSSVLPDSSGLSEEEERLVKEAADEDGKDKIAKTASGAAGKNEVETESVPDISMAFYNALDKETKIALDQQADKTFDSFIASDDKIVEFGKSSVEAVNSVVDRLLEIQKHIRIPEIDDLLEQANRDLDGYSAKYKDQIEEKKPSFLTVWFRSKKRNFDDMVFDRQNLVHRMDIIDGKVIAKREELKQSSSYVKQLLITNKESMNKMVGVIAALESIHLAAKVRARDMEHALALIDKDSPKWQDVQDKFNRIAEVSNAVEQQHSNYMSRLAIARATNSQVRNFMHTSATVIRNLSMVHTYTIPVIKQSIAQIGYATTLKDASSTAESLKNANEHALKIMGDFTSKTLPGIEEKAQQPIVSADAISKLSDNVIAGNVSIVNAIKRGRESRLALEKAVQAANDKIQDSDMLRDEELVKALLNEGQDDDKAVKDFDDMASKAYHREE